MKINKDLYIGDTNKQLKDVITEVPTKLASVQFHDMIWTSYANYVNDLKNAFVGHESYVTHIGSFYCSGYGVGTYIGAGEMAYGFGCYLVMINNITQRWQCLHGEWYIANL